MTVQNDKAKEVLLGDGITTVFPYTFALLDKSHIKVYLTDLDGNTTMLESGYSVDTKNRNVIYPYPFGKPLPAGWKMTIMRVVPITQEMDLINQGALPNETLEKAYDKLTMIAQQLNEESNRSLKADVSVIGAPYQLPAPAPGKVVGWNEDGTGMANYDNPSEASSIARAAADRAEEAADRAAAAADAVGDATHEATPNTLIRRDADGRAKVAAPVEADDIARKVDLEALYPIGTVYENAITSANPATYLGFGTWEPFGQGRVTVGVDTSQVEFDSVQKTGGAKTHTLTIDEIPPHTHQYEQFRKGDGSRESPGYWEGRQREYWTTLPAGGGQPHNNLQPYITVYRWVRVA